MRYNQAAVDRLTAPGWHHIADNLYLRIGPNDGRVWLFRYSRQGKNQWLGLGTAKDVTFKKAKKKAHGLRQALIDGRDPADEKRAGEAERETTVPTFEKCAAQFLADNAGTWSNAKHAAQWASTLATYAAPSIGKLPVNEITASLIAELLRPIWTAKRETASRVRGRVERVLHWAAAKGYRTGENPAAIVTLRHLLPVRPPKRLAVKHREAVPWAEVPALVAELRNRDSTSARALLFTILTAARTGEATGALWGEIEPTLWTVPAARMKRRKTHRVPLAGPVVELLAMLPRGRPDAFLFPGGKPGKPLSNMAMLELLRGMRPGAGLTVHGFRSSFTDWAAETGHARDVARTALSHAVRDATEAAYLRTDHLDARRPLMEAWANHCFGRVAPVKRQISIAHLPKFGRISKN